MVDVCLYMVVEGVDWVVVVSILEKCVIVKVGWC